MIGSARDDRDRYSAVDLYAGAGGLSLGLQQAGVQLKAAVEVDRWAADTYRSNFEGVELWQQRVSELPKRFFDQHYGVDIVVGGPPCQGFSVCAGKRRLEDDSRNREIVHFLDAAIRLQPTCILLENVPDLTRHKASNGNLVQEIKNRLVQNGYLTNQWTVDCSNFGVPQRRKRLFLLASRVEPVLDLISLETHGELQSTGDKAPRLTVGDAIGDLPEVHARGVDEGAWFSYETQSQNDYQRQMRSGSSGFYNHVPMRHSPRLIERFASIPIGGNGALVWEDHPANARGDNTRRGVRFAQNHRRMSLSLPAPTIAAHMYSTCLHPLQNRNITVREAARLQSFPDSFRFFGKRTTLSRRLLERKGLVEDLGLNQLNQVGNAVPPLMAQRLAFLMVKSIVGGVRAKCA